MTGVDTACLFCRIAAGTEAADLVLDTPEVLAFLDTRPVFKGHVLVIPRQHVETIVELPSALVHPLFSQVQRIAGAVLAAFGAQGSFVATNSRISQSVPHLHVHVVPRAKGDGLRGFFWPRTRYSSAEEAKDYARRLADALG
jgi:histidine triad (HIT) family protein